MTEDCGLGRCQRVSTRARGEASHTSLVVTGAGRQSSEGKGVNQE